MEQHPTEQAENKVAEVNVKFTKNDQEPQKLEEIFSGSALKEESQCCGLKAFTWLAIFLITTSAFLMLLIYVGLERDFIDHKPKPKPEIEDISFHNDSLPIALNIKKHVFE